MFDQRAFSSGEAEGRAMLVLSSGGGAENCGWADMGDGPVVAGLGRAGTEGTAGDGMKAMRGCALGGGHVIWRL